jgi:hypothetical protein
VERYRHFKKLEVVYLDTPNEIYLKKKSKRPLKIDTLMISSLNTHFDDIYIKDIELKALYLIGYGSYRLETMHLPKFRTLKLEINNILRLNDNFNQSMPELGTIDFKAKIIDFNGAIKCNENLKRINLQAENPLYVDLGENCNLLSILSVQSVEEATIDYHHRIPPNIKQMIIVGEKANLKNVSKIDRKATSIPYVSLGVHKNIDDFKELFSLVDITKLRVINEVSDLFLDLNYLNLDVLKTLELSIRSVQFQKIDRQRYKRPALERMTMANRVPADLRDLLKISALKEVELTYLDYRSFSSISEIDAKGKMKIRSVNWPKDEKLINKYCRFNKKYKSLVEYCDSLRSSMFQ